VVLALACLRQQTSQKLRRRRHHCVLLTVLLQAQTGGFLQQLHHRLPMTPLFCRYDRPINPTRLLRWTQRTRDGVKDTIPVLLSDSFADFALVDAFFFRSDALTPLNENKPPSSLLSPELSILLDLNLNLRFLNNWTCSEVHFSTSRTSHGHRQTLSTNSRTLSTL